MGWSGHVTDLRPDRYQSYTMVNRINVYGRSLMASPMVTVGARMPPRELAIAAVMAGMPDATVAEITRYAYRRFLGDTPEEARNVALSNRNTAAGNANVHDELIVARLPKEWVEEAQNRMSEMNASTVHRYVIASIATEDSQEAMSLATRKRGRPRNSETGK